MGENQFACESCGKTYRWKPELTGRRVKCVCGHVMPVTAPPPSVAEEDDALYDIVADEPSSAPPRVSVAAVATAVAAPAPPRAQTSTPPLGYATAKVSREESSVEHYFPDRTKDLHLPLAFIAIGTVVNVGMAMFDRSRFAQQTTLPYVLGTVFVFMIVNAIIMLGVVFLVAKERGITMGPTPTAILKLCGISIGPGAIGTLVGLMLSFIPIVGPIIGWIAGFILYFAAIGALFDWDESDTWRVVIAAFFAKLLVFVGFIFLVR